MADDKIGLQKIILGLPFLNQTCTKMHFHTQKTTVRSILDTNQGQKYVNLQLKDDRPLYFCNENKIDTQDLIKLQ